VDWKLLKDLRVHPDRVTLKGRCPCSKPGCNYWVLEHDGRTRHAREATYDRIAWIKGNS
jgi:hypothetical protein